ncbi:hypothetical protein L7F22_016728, partial [Adiantum nelumboides]|nr:hypothetical protein [Adiantum nelumboides]
VLEHLLRHPSAIKAQRAVDIHSRMTFQAMVVVVNSVKYYPKGGFKNVLAAHYTLIAVVAVSSII